MNKITIKNIEYIAVSDVVKMLEDICSDGGADAMKYAPDFLDELNGKVNNYKQRLEVERNLSEIESKKEEEREQLFQEPIKTQIQNTVYNCTKEGEWCTGALAFLNKTPLDVVKSKLKKGFFLVRQREEGWYSILSNECSSLCFSDLNLEVIKHEKL